MTGNIPDQSEIVYCLRCGRKLKDPIYKELGMGPVCYAKSQTSPHHKKLFTIKNKNKNPIDKTSE